MKIRPDHTGRGQAGVPARRIAVVVPGLSAGGTEHVVNMLSNAWAEKGWRVDVITFDRPGSAPYYPFRPEIRIHRVGLPPSRMSRLRAVASAAGRVQQLRRTIRAIAPEMVLTFLTRTNVQVLLATRGLCVPVVVSERNNPALQDVGPIWRTLRAQLYPKAFGLVTMTRGALEMFPPSQRRRGWVIPNAVDLPAAGERRRGGNRLVAVGRLVEQKGFDLLLEAFARIADEVPDWTLVIWGEGPDRADLEALRSRLGLDGRVNMPGVTERPGIWVETADAFVLSSRYEGWGIVLLEAMASELPVVSFDCKWGPREMLTDGRDGLLVPPGDVEALAGALRRLLTSPALRDRLATAASETARAFARERVVGMWDEVVVAAATAGVARR